MPIPGEPLTRQQRFGLRVVVVSGSLMVLLSIAGLTFLRSDLTTRTQVLEVVELVCGGLLAGVSGRRLRAARKR